MRNISQCYENCGESYKEKSSFYTSRHGITLSLGLKQIYYNNVKDRIYIYENTIQTIRRKK